MIEPGKIIIGIDRKVYFEPDGLEKPKEENYWRIDEYTCEVFGYHEFYTDSKEYEASKQLIEVSNDYYLRNYGYHSISGLNKTGSYVFKDNQPCKAEVTDNKATIVELTKE